MDDYRKDVQWSPRVPKRKLRQLYERACQGLWDEDLIDEVGMMLYLRCRDILNIHRAQTERQVTCARCDRQGRLTLIDCRQNRGQPMICPVCDWQMTWRDYHRTFQRRQLNPGGAVTYFQDYVTRYESARIPKDKMLLIDRVIHEFHYSLRSDPIRPTRPAGVNLIVGQLEDVVNFLDELSGLNLPVPLQETHAEWHTKYGSTYWPDFLKSRRPTFDTPGGCQ
jgi:uncharacterized CHY-type Zn-finger protein